jgi:hypothetical protein
MSRATWNMCVSTRSPRECVLRPRHRGPAAHQLHSRQLFDEYEPATPTEIQLTKEIIDTAWRLNHSPSLEAAPLDRAANPPTEQARSTSKREIRICGVQACCDARALACRVDAL